MYTTAWKFEETGDGVIYSIQFDSVPWKFRKAIHEAMRDWSKVSYGWYKNNNNQLFIFKRKFKSLEDWTKWASRFPLEIQEKRIWGERERIISHGKKAKNG